MGEPNGPGRDEARGSEEAASQLQARLDELLDLLKRERADFLNYKRRVERERAEDRQRAKAETVERLLPPLDELDRALTHVPADLANHPWVRGVLLIRQLLNETLDDVGIARVGQVGEPFDPVLHEAVSYRQDPGATDHHIGAVLRSGYVVDGRLLRAAQVEVVGPAEEAAIAPGRPAERGEQEPSGPASRDQNASLGG